ncbi:hypothetical protein K488DRAFT_82418 [Vararia minispora EC-137]|uniref:Uncharacterized protein n=1 Tax=Vararia minispora EC-137 TaxID=1314806 RepID=A0ACB8QX07_9AGAM|nr:hypothetical protein K488DRAFT_82418 [Vararia minispora EC-137]
MANKPGIPLPPEAYISFRNYLHPPPIPPNRAAFAMLSPEVAVTSRKAPDSSRLWRQGYYLWISHSRRAIVHHLTADMRLPLDSTAIYYNQRVLWEQRKSQLGKEPRTPTNSYIYSVLLDMQPANIRREYNIASSTLFPLPPAESFPLKEEVLEVFSPVMDACGRLYAAARTLAARDMLVARQLSRQWSEGHLMPKRNRDVSSSATRYLTLFAMHSLFDM